MIFIAHRGNLNGKVKSMENFPLYITQAIEKGFDVEIDVWFRKNQFFLGHDAPTHSVSLNFLLNSRLWCHCKTIETLAVLKGAESHCFFHDQDGVTLTSKGFLWAYPSKDVVAGTICVLPETVGVVASQLVSSVGICSDFISEYKESLGG